VDVAVIDRRDFVRYKGQFLQTGWARPFYDGGFERLSGLFESWGREEYGGVEVLEKGGMGIRRGLEKEDVEGEYDFLLGPVGTTKVELRK
jgi:hypothetical protein